MSKTLIPPISQHVFTSACNINDKLVVVLFERNGTFNPESRPAHVKQVACNTNGAAGNGEDESSRLASRFVQMGDRVLYNLRQEISGLDVKKWESAYCQQRHDQKPKLEADCSNILGDVISKAVNASSGADQSVSDHLRIVHVLE